MRQIIEGAVFDAVDGVLKDIPNGAQYRGKFQQAISDSLTGLRQQAQSELGQLVPGGILGEKPIQEVPPPGH
jgi:hypothetical protein